MCRTLKPPTILIPAITFNAVATIGLSMTTNLPDNTYVQTNTYILSTSRKKTPKVHLIPAFDRQP